MVTVFLPWTLPDKSPDPEEKKRRERSDALDREEVREPDATKARQDAPPSEYYLG